MTKKIIGWERHLIEYVQSVSRNSIETGVFDCALFAAGAVLAITGDDYAIDFRNKYRTYRHGKKMLKQLGFNDHVEYAASVLVELESPLFAQRGDIVVLEDQDGLDAFGVVQGEYVYVPTVNGLNLVPLEQAKRAFRV